MTTQDTATQDVVISAVEYGPDRLAAQLPVIARVYPIGGDTDDPLYCAEFDTPLQIPLPPDIDHTRCAPEYLDSDEHGTFIWAYFALILPDHTSPRTDATTIRAALGIVPDQSTAANHELHHDSAIWAATVTLTQPSHVPDEDHAAGVTHTPHPAPLHQPQTHPQHTETQDTADTTTDPSPEQLHETADHTPIHTDTTHAAGACDHTPDHETDFAGAADIVNTPPPHHFTDDEQFSAATPDHAIEHPPAAAGTSTLWDPTPSHPHHDTHQPLSDIPPITSPDQRDAPTSPDQPASPNHSHRFVPATLSWRGTSPTRRTTAIATAAVAGVATLITLGYWLGNSADTTPSTPSDISTPATTPVAPTAASSSPPPPPPPTTPPPSGNPGRTYIPYYPPAPNRTNITTPQTRGPAISVRPTHRTAFPNQPGAN